MLPKIIVYFLLYKSVPFNIKTIINRFPPTTTTTTTTPPPPPPTPPSKFSRQLHRALAPKPQNRL